MAKRGKTPRFELTLPDDLRTPLDEIAVATGSTVAELLRLGASWVAHHRQFLIQGKPGEAA